MCEVRSILCIFFIIFLYYSRISYSKHCANFIHLVAVFTTNSILPDQAHVIFWGTTCSIAKKFLKIFCLSDCTSFSLYVITICQTMSLDHVWGITVIPNEIVQYHLICCTVHGILLARILEWVTVSFSRGSSQLGDWTHVSHIAGRFFTSWTTREAQESCSGYLTYPFSRGSSRPRNQIGIFCIAGRFFASRATRESPIIYVVLTETFLIAKSQWWKA